jgi:hypothetical protein
MTMMNANTNKDEDNNSGGWKQVRSCKATGTFHANKTINSSEKEDGMTSYEVKTGIIEVRFCYAAYSNRDVSAHGNNVRTTHSEHARMRTT